MFRPRCWHVEWYGYVILISHFRKYFRHSEYKLRSWKRFFWCMNDEPTKMYKNAIFKQNYSLKLCVAFRMPIFLYQFRAKSRFSTFPQNHSLSIAFWMAYFCCINLGQNLDFLHFLQKWFYNIDYWRRCFSLSPFFRKSTNTILRLSRQKHLDIK